MQRQIELIGAAWGLGGPEPGCAEAPATLIPLVAEHYGCPPEELVEMRTAVDRDPSVALASFRAMARELGPTLDPTRPTSR